MFLNHLNNNIQLLLDNKTLSIYKDKINQILSSNQKIELLRKEVKNIVLKIDSQKNLNNDLKSLISKGLEIISSSKQKNCPLCLNDYNSYKELSSTIENNPLINDLLKKSLKEKSDIEVEIKNITDKNKIIKNEIRDSIENKIKQIEQIKTDKSVKLKNFKEQIKKNQNTIVDLKKEIEQISTPLNGLSFQDYKIKHQNELENYILKKDSTNKNFNTTKAEIQKIKTWVDKISNEIKLFEKSIQDEKNVNEYITIQNFFKNKVKVNNISLDKLNETLDNNNSQINKLKESVNAKEVEIKNFNEILTQNNFTKEELNEQIESNLDAQNFLYKNIKNFEGFILSDFNIDLSDLPENEATLQFQEIKNNFILKEKLKKELFKNYKIIEKIKDKAYKALENEKIEEKKEKLNTEIQLLDNVNKKLNTEKIGLETYLKETIDNYFYTELINKIYSKIDPHPNNYKIEFDCDFKEKNPRLQIYTSDIEDSKSVPSLYFSSAQINILSLSIFLARALKATDPTTKESIKCIFIDDPIQSMDSINILSFIDLFRSIILNLDRQLIISTHEENFYLLLQKKIPSSIFKSKFLKFESFGKLEQPTLTR